MRIISGFRDYYDCIQAYGQDDDLLYVRRKSVVTYDGPGHRYQYPLPRFDSWHSGLPRASAITIGFCGKIHHGLVFSESGAICYSPDDVAASVIRTLPKRLQTLYVTKPGRKPSRWSKSPSEVVAKFFGQENKQSHYARFFEKAPIFVGREDAGISRSSVTYNDCLRPLDFMRALNPYSAFQELFMWLSNQAKPFKPIPAVSDADMIIAKGFDKHSFRKQPCAS